MTVQVLHAVSQDEIFHIFGDRRKQLVRDHFATLHSEMEWPVILMKEIRDKADCEYYSLLVGAATGPPKEVLQFKGRNVP